MIEIECVVDSASLLGEATYWDPKEQVLWWIDIWGPTIHRTIPRPARTIPGRRRNISGPSRFVRREGSSCRWCSGSISSIPRRPHARPSSTPRPVRRQRFNDGKTDRQGRFWSGTMFEASGNAGEDRFAVAARQAISGPQGDRRRSAARTGSPGVPTAAPCISPTATPTWCGRMISTRRPARRQPRVFIDLTRREIHRRR